MHAIYKIRNKEYIFWICVDIKKMHVYVYVYASASVCVCVCANVRAYKCIQLGKRLILSRT